MPNEYIRDTSGNSWAVRGADCLQCGQPLEAWEIPSGFHPQCETRHE